MPLFVSKEVEKIEYQKKLLKWATIILNDKEGETKTIISTNLEAINRSKMLISNLILELADACEIGEKYELTGVKVKFKSFGLSLQIIYQEVE